MLIGSKFKQSCERGARLRFSPSCSIVYFEGSVITAIAVQASVVQQLRAEQRRFTVPCFAIQLRQHV